MSERWGPNPPATPPTAHLDDVDLAGTPTPVQLKHLTDCGLCHARAGRIAPDEAFGDLLAQLETLPVPAETMAQAGHMALPSRLVTLLANDTVCPDRVRPGQLWGLQWRGRTMLTVVLGVHACWADVAPLTTDVVMADEYALVLDPESTALSQPCGVFVRAHGNVPLETLERYIGDVTAEGTPITPRLDDLVDAYQRQAPPPTRVPTGRELDSEDWDRRGYLDTLDEELSWFGTAMHGIVDSDGQVVGASGQAEEYAKPDLDAIFAGHSNVDIAAATGIPRGRLLNIRQHRASPTSQEAQLLAHVSGSTTESTRTDVTARNNALLEAVYNPAMRQHRIAWTKQQHKDADPRDPRPLLRLMMTSQAAARSVPEHGSEDDEYERWFLQWRAQLAFRLFDG